jgi:hypothetical protein
MLDLAAVSAVLLLALTPRLINLDSYSGLFDEGIRVEQLFLMSHGYRPFREIFAAQGPLLLDAYYPLYALFAALLPSKLVAARLVVVTYSLVGLAGLYWVGHQLAGRAGGLAAALLLALSPLYLEGSRLALAEVPALAPAILALGCSLRYSRPGSGTIWLVAAGLLLTISLLMKPIALAAAPAVALAALLRGRRGLRDLLLVGLAMLLLASAAVWLLGFHEIRDQILAYRAASRDAAGWSVRKNLQAIQNGLTFEPLALLPLSALGGIALLLADWRRTLPAVVWALTGLLLLLVYSPLHGKHLVVIVPGLTLLVGAGAVAAWRLGACRWPEHRNLVVGLPLLLAAVWYLAGLLPLLAHTGQLLRVTADTDVDPAFEQYADAVAAIRALTQPDEFVVTDQPYLAFLAERKVPPELVDTAITRIRSRSLTSSKAQAQAANYQPRVVLLWGDRLRSLGGFKSWVEQNYQVVKVYNRRGDTDRALYLRRGADLRAARAMLADPLGQAPSADFGGDLRLVSARVDQAEVRPGEGATVSLVWELLRPTTTDYHVLLDLRDAQGVSLDDQQESLSGGSSGTSEWAPGRWLVQSSFVRTDRLSPGSYTVTVALYDSRTRRIIPPDGAPADSSLPIGSLSVNLAPADW